MDPDAFRTQSRELWERAAAGWEARHDDFGQAAQPVSVWLVEHVHPQPGHRILELAGGLGDTGLLAAELVAPGGQVVITDGAEAMVEAARRQAERRGLRNVELKQMEAEWIDEPAASFDGVVCRWGFMLLADPEAALRETRRVLKSGGRVALAAWATAEENPWMSAIGGELVAMGVTEPPEPGTPGPFAFGREGHITELLEGAGFEDVEEDVVDFTFGFTSLDHHFESMVTQSLSLQEQLKGLTPAQHTALRDGVDARLAQYAGDDGSVVLPARTRVAAAQA